MAIDALTPRTDHDSKDAPVASVFSELSACGFPRPIQNAVLTCSACRVTGRVQKRQRSRDTRYCGDSLEIPGWVAKLVPIDARLTGDAGSGVHNLCIGELSLKAPRPHGRGWLSSTSPGCRQGPRRRGDFKSSSETREIPSSGNIHRDSVIHQTDAPGYSCSAIKRSCTSRKTSNRRGTEDSTSLGTL